MFDKIRPFFTAPPRRPTSPLGAGLSDEDEPAIPAFQQAWKQGATFEDLFGPSPFTLHGSVGRSGADNHRPDVAKVETFLGDAGYYKPLTNDGPSGWHSTNLDSAIRSFQKDHGLAVDGLLKPNGPTIGKIGSLLGGGAAPQAKPDGANKMPGEWDWMEKPSPKPTDGPERPGGIVSDHPQSKPVPPTAFPQGQPKLVRGNPTGMISEIPNDPAVYEWFLEYPDGTRVPTSPPAREGRLGDTSIPDRFPGHTISESGAKEHDDWAKLLVRDSDPSQTARMLTVAIKKHGDQGRGDVADLLGRFHQIDPAKAETLRRAVKDATGEDLPFRVAPLGEGFRELTDEEKLARAPKSPFGSAQGADRWAAGNMADVLLGKGDYADAVKHFRADKRHPALSGRRARDHGRQEPDAGDEVRHPDARRRPGHGGGRSPTTDASHLPGVHAAGDATAGHQPAGNHHPSPDSGTDTGSHTGTAQYNDSADFHDRNGQPYDVR